MFDMAADLTLLPVACVQRATDMAVLQCCFFQWSLSNTLVVLLRAWRQDRTFDMAADLTLLPVACVHMA